MPHPGTARRRVITARWVLDDSTFKPYGATRARQ
jgi:hypothetical protein